VSLVGYLRVPYSRCCWHVWA